MDYQVRKARMRDLGRIKEIYAYARSFMAANGNPNQWGKTHPPVEQIRQDIEEENLYVITTEEEIHGVFFFLLGDDPTYAQIFNGAWHCDLPYGVIHRIAGDGSGGILKTAVEFAKNVCQYIRIDTHEENVVMQRALEKLDFQKCGIIYLKDGNPRIAYDHI